MQLTSASCVRRLLYLAAYSAIAGENSEELGTMAPEQLLLQYMPRYQEGGRLQYPMQLNGYGLPQALYCAADIPCNLQRSARMAGSGCSATCAPVSRHAAVAAEGTPSPT